MEEATTPFSLLQEMLNKILGALAGVGIELPPIVVQVFLLALVLGIVALFLPKREEWRSKPVATLGVAAVALVAIGIFFTWVQQAGTHFPQEVVGVIIIDSGDSASSYENMYVELADDKGRKLSTGTAYVDSENKTVLLYYAAQMGNLPKKVVVTAPACEPASHEYGIGIAELSAGEFTRHLRCKAS